MPTVLRLAGFRILVLFPPRAHGPAHVHVVNATGIVVINLASSSAPQSVERVEGMSKADVRRIMRIVRDHAGLLLAEWRKIHGGTD